MLSEIPRSVCVEVLSNWCALKCLVNLDSAACNRSFREYLLGLYGIKHFAMPKKFTIAQSFAAMTWLSLRNIKLSELHHASNIQTNIDCSKVNILCVTNFGKVKMESHTLIKLILQCPLVNSLKIDGVHCMGLDVVSGVSDSVWQQLSELRISDCSKLFNGYCIQYLADKCHNLTKLHIGKTCGNVKESDLIELLRSSRGLIHVILQVSHQLGSAIINAVSECLPNITYLKARAYAIGPEALLNLIASCPKLRDVELKEHVRYLLSPDPVTGVLKKSLGLAGIHKSKGDVLLSSDERLGLTENIYTQITDCCNIFIRFVLRDSFLDTIAKYNPNLEQLTISYAGMNYTADAIANLVRACPRLHTLEFASRHLTDDDVVTIFEVPNNITCVSFFEHDELEDETLIYIVENVPSVRTICVEMCRLVHFSFLKVRYSDFAGRKIKWETKLKKILPTTTVFFNPNFRM